jgi:hypothetical protein
MEVFPMKKMSWILSALALAALTSTSTAQEPKAMPADQPAPMVTTAPVYLNGGCSDSGCCNSCCNRGGPIVDVGFMLLTPKWKDNPAFFSVNDSHTPTVMTQQDFSFHTQYVPQVSLGYMGCSGLGFRVGWWGFAQTARETIQGARSVFSDAASPLQLQELANLDVDTFGIGTTLATEAELRMNVWDFEAVQACGNTCWSALFSAGIRYAHISQEYNALTFTNAGDPRNFILSGHNFNGAGPTLAVEVRRLVAGTGLYVYAKARGSVLFGTSKQSGDIGSFIVIEEEDPPTNRFHADSRSNSVVPEGEIELGAGFERALRRGGVLFLQMGVVGQAWGHVGNSSESAGGPPNFFWREETAAIDREGALGLIGFTLRTGLNW